MNEEKKELLNHYSEEWVGESLEGGKFRNFKYIWPDKILISS